jgi:hypothetical protein
MKKILTPTAILVVATTLGLGLLNAPVATASTRATAHVTIPACSPTQMRVTFGPANGAAGTIYHPVIFTNVSNTVCVINGIPLLQPGVSSTSMAHTSPFAPVGPLSRNNTTSNLGSLITLRPSMSASATMGVTDTGNYPAQSCAAHTANAVRVRIMSIVATISFGPFTTCTRLASTSTLGLTLGTQG